MKLSIIVIFHNMAREALRTLHSLNVGYQRNVRAEDYEIIIIDNGSEPALDPAVADPKETNFRFFRLERTGVSPVDAVNFGVEQSSSEMIAVIVDGARMATPGLVATTLQALTLSQAPFVCALSWHLGPDIQSNSILNGYDKNVEDTLLKAIDWPRDGYRLFEISTLAPSSGVGFLGGVPTECSWFAMPRSQFLKLGGFDTRFKSPGGGRMNHDFRDRALAQDGIQPIVLIGEGVFHQIHGGVTTNVPIEDRDRLRQVFWKEYREIRGIETQATIPSEPLYLGYFHPSARGFILKL